MKKTVWAFLFLLELWPAVAEEASVQNPPWRARIAAGYFSDVATHPGFLIGAEFPVSIKGRRELSVAANIRFFRIPYFASDLIADVDFIYRSISPIGLFFSAQAGTGYMHSFLDGTGYDLVGGAVIKIPDSGRPMWIFDAAFGLGWNFSIKTKAPVEFFVKVGYLGEYPNNEGVLSHLTLETGIGWLLKRK